MLWLENLLSQATVERLGWMLVHFLWQATVVAMLLAGLLRRLRRSSANVRYLTACAALMLMVVLPIATMQFIEVPGPAAEAGPEPEPLVTTAAPASVVRMPEETFTLSDVPLEIADVTIPVPWNERITSAFEPALPYAVLGWLVGVFGLSAWHLGGWMQLQRLKRRMVHGVSAPLQQRLAQIAGRLGVPRAVTLLESALVEVPTVVGWLRPVILLPASALTGLSPEQLEAILAHELAHIRRYDYLVNVLQTVVEILGFYHPAVWWVSRRIRIERENCCDDMAVHVCGDSVRYARALTCLEEIRHSQTELAIAATGGSLLDRIARLLGRPTADDRRFAWLPGLITLLLVAGVVVPAALALAGADARLSEPPADEATVLTDASQAQAEPNDPNRTQMLLDFYIAEAFSDTILDQDTATQVVDLLARIPAGDAQRTAATDVPPSIDELRQPLADVFTRFAPKSGKSRHLMDWLVSRGYAKIVCNPRLQAFTGQEAAIAVGSTPDPNATEAENRERTFMRLTVTANDVPDQNATKLKIDFTRTYPAYKPGDPNQETTMATIRSTLVAPNDQYMSISERVVKRVDENGRERLVLAFVRPAIVQTPEAPSSVTINEPSASETNDADKAYVQVGVKIIKAIDSSELDRETVLKIENILGKRVRPEGRAGEFGPRFHLTVGEVLRDHVVQESLPGETMDALLPLFKDVEVLSSPRVVARDGTECQVRIGHDEYVRAAPPADGSSEPGKLERIEAGVKIDLTPHIGDHNAVTLEIVVGTTDVLRPSAGEDVPVVRRRIVQAAATVYSGQCITLAGTTEWNTPAPGKDEESVYIMAMPTIVEGPIDDTGANEIAPGMGGMGGFRESSGEVTTRVFGDPITATFANVDLREVLAEISRRGRVSIVADETVKPKAVTAELAGASVEESLRRVLTGTPYVFKRIGETTNARKEQPRITNLWQGDQLRLVLQDIATIATMTGVPIITDETVVGSVCADVKDVPLETALEMVLAGTPYVIRKTPDYYLVASRGQRTFDEESNTSPWPQGTYLVYRPISNIFSGVSRQLALMDLAAAAEVSIAVDENVTGEIDVELNAVPLETALRMVTAGTPYVVEKKADHYEVTRQKTSPESKTRSDSGVPRSPQTDDTRKRLVLLDTRIVAMERRDLSDLAVEWTQENADRAATTPAAESDVRTGRLPDRISPDFLITKLDLLEQDSRADIISHPQVTAKEGEQSKFQCAMDGHYYRLPDYTLTWRSDCRSLLITPLIGVRNDISLDISYGHNIYERPVSDLRSDWQDPNSPTTKKLDTRRSVITVPDGGTAVLTMADPLLSEPKSKRVPMGVPEFLLQPALQSGGSHEGDSARVIAFFFTARLTRDPNGLSPEALKTTEPLMFQDSLRRGLGVE